MSIRKVEDADLDEIVRFNTRLYPKRNKIKESFVYRFYDNPFSKNLINESLIALDSNNNIVGQDLLMPSILLYQGKQYPAFWEMDFIVDERYRGMNGVLLAKKATVVRNLFGVGYSKQSIGLRLAIGEPIIGCLVKYIKICNPFFFLHYYKIIKKNKTVTDFPETINLKNGNFNRVRNSESILSQNGSWNKNYLEFTRNKEFVDWRFFTYKDKYFVYSYLPIQNNISNNPVYFIVRPIIWENMHCLLLVDYRLDLDNIKMFETILKTVSKLAFNMKYDAIIAGCSIPGYEKTLKRKFFFPFGERMDIISRFYKTIDSSTHERNVFVTFADSDCDFYYGNDYHW
jgi:hypothetical protein